jgi:hypothetical protein
MAYETLRENSQEKVEAADFYNWGEISLATPCAHFMWEIWLERNRHIFKEHEFNVLKIKLNIVSWALNPKASKGISSSDLS